jgi:DNA mismatch endonuclease (patch repair protein)
MQGNRGRDTRPEVALRSALHRRGLRFRKHAAPLPGLLCRSDVLFPRERVVVFVDGCFWHQCPDHGKRPKSNQEYWDAKIARNVERDSRNNEALREAGWMVIRVWEHEAVEETSAAIEGIVRERRSSR